MNWRKKLKVYAEPGDAFGRLIVVAETLEGYVVTIGEPNRIMEKKCAGLQKQT